MMVQIDGTDVLSKVSVSNTAFANFTASVFLAPGSHTLAISYPNDFYSAGVCDRNRMIDVSTVSASTSSPISISNVPCIVTLNGIQQTGICYGTFTHWVRGHS